MAQLIESPSQDYTFIGLGTQLQGNVIFKGDAKVAGSLKGEIRSETSPLSIEPTGRFEGTLYCHNLEVYGEVKGDIHSTGKVILYPSSQFEGQLQASQLVIHPGANVNMDAKTEKEESISSPESPA